MCAKTVSEYKCLNCGAGLAFNPESQNWDCNYCFSSFSKEELDKAYHVEAASEEDMPELDSYHCTSCGAELVADQNTSATFCVYCKNPTVIKSRFSGKFKPKSLIPFQFTKEKAQELYTNWVRRRLFAPSEFKSREEAEKITGVYAPYWLFDCEVFSAIEAEATTVKTWTSGDYRYTKTKYYIVIRGGTASYDNIPIDASKKLDDELMHKVEPYDYKDLKDFSMQYMSGFMAERYDVESDEAKKVMEQRVKNYMEESLKSTVKGYNSFRVTDVELQLLQANKDYSMLPVYLLVEKYKDKEHLFVINGQTGKIVGKTPISIVKMLAFGAAVFFGTWILTVLGGAFLV